MIENDEREEIYFVEELSYIPPPKELIETHIKINNNTKPKMEKKKMSDLNLHGVENLKKVSVAITSLINAGVTSYSDDGKITFGDVGHFIRIIPEIISAIPAVKYVKEEVTDKITPQEFDELKTAIFGSIEIKNELDAEFMNEAMNLLHGISKLVTNRIQRSKEVSS